MQTLSVNVIFKSVKSFQAAMCTITLVSIDLHDYDGIGYNEHPTTKSDFFS